MIRIAFQGERGAYSEEAAISVFNEKIETVSFQTFAEILDQTLSGKTNFAVLPVENSLEGSVGESYDLLYSTSLKAIGEIYHKIEHCLIGTGNLQEVDTVYSHPQALGQCRKFLQEKNMKTVPTYDTAGSVRIVKELGKNNIACIASKKASEIYSVPIIREGIANNPNNYTRFLILSREETEKENDGKTSIIFSIKHEPGALYKIIEKFQSTEVNLTKIESRPKKDTVWEYNFFVDFEGNAQSRKIKEMLEGIKDHTTFFKILGTYPMAKRD